MHPARSVIFFSTASGAGYGLLALLGVAISLDIVPPGQGFGLLGMALALGLVSAGLLSSMLHLRHPERAWRAATQWRSSWLSREGVVALITYVPAVSLAVGWIVLQRTTGVWATLGIISAIGAAVTVYCTGMIYASLKPIRQWHNPWVVPVYLGFALMTGALWLLVLIRLIGARADWLDVVAASAILIAWALKLAYWRSIAAGTTTGSIKTATGLTDADEVRVFEPPHSEQNYLLKEMGFQIARKHAHKLRTLAVGLGFALPLAAMILLRLLDGVPATVIAFVAAGAAMIGVLIERWLFFAEAEHTVMLYYQR